MSYIIQRKQTIDLIKSHMNLLPRFCNSDNLCGLANHHPMMMYSLFKLGASQERIQQASEIYLQRIPNKKALINLHNNLTSNNTNNNQDDDYYVKVTINENNFLDYIGQDQHYFNYYQFFQKQALLFKTPQDFLTHYLFRIPSFLYSEAFHCLIRLGFLLEMELTDAYAQVLAQIATADFKFKSLEQNYSTESENNNKTTRPFLEILQYFLQNDEIRTHFEKMQLRGIIVDRMRTVDQDSIFLEYTKNNIVKYEGEKTLDELIDILLRVYIITDNFTIMHGLNSLYAYKMILPYLQLNHTIAFQQYFNSILIAFLTTFRLYNYQNLIQEMNDIPILKELPSFQDIFDKVILSEDDHHAKTVYALYQQSLVYKNNSLFQYKAAQIAKLI